jgi:hypothetical protein
MMNIPKTDSEALVMALLLAIDAPTDEQKRLATKLADEFAAKLTTEQVEACKAIAKQNAELN